MYRTVKTGTGARANRNTGKNRWMCHLPSHTPSPQEIERAVGRDRTVRLCHRHNMKLPARDASEFLISFQLQGNDGFFRARYSRPFSVRTSRSGAQNLSRHHIAHHGRLANILQTYLLATHDSCWYQEKLDRRVSPLYPAANETHRHQLRHWLTVC